MIQNLTLRPSLTRDELKKSLAIKCGAGEGDASALDFLIDFIVYTELVEEDENGTLTRGNLDEVEQSLPASASAAVSPTSSIGIGSERRASIEAAKGGDIALVIHLHIGSFEELTPDHASRLRQWLESLRGTRGLVEVQVGVGESQEKAE